MYRGGKYRGEDTFASVLVSEGLCFCQTCNYYFKYMKALLYIVSSAFSQLL